MTLQPSKELSAAEQTLIEARASGIRSLFRNRFEEAGYRLDNWDDLLDLYAESLSDVLENGWSLLARSEAVLNELCVADALLKVLPRSSKLTHLRRGPAARNGPLFRVSQGQRSALIKVVTILPEVPIRWSVTDAPDRPAERVQSLMRDLDTKKRLKSAAKSAIVEACASFESTLLALRDGADHETDEELDVPLLPGIRFRREPAGILVLSGSGFIWGFGEMQSWCSQYLAPSRLQRGHEANADERPLSSGAIDAVGFLARHHYEHDPRELRWMV